MGRPQVVAMVSSSSSTEHAVTVPDDSVSPYAVTTCGNSSDLIRRTSATGTSAAPVTASRSDDRSCSARPGASSRDV